MAAKMSAVVVPGTSFVKPRDYEKEADYVLESLEEVPSLFR